MVKEPGNKLAEIQATLKAPKSRFNSFGKYNYRNCEDILESVKPLLAIHGLVLTINDEPILVGDRVYIKATARISGKDLDISVSAVAREAKERKGMDDAQLTGATSSYARKYALSGLFLLDDSQDSDATNTHGKGGVKTKIDRMGKVTDGDEIYFQLHSGDRTYTTKDEDLAIWLKSMTGKEVELTLNGSEIVEAR